jgi:hypothetical protein
MHRGEKNLTGARGDDEAACHGERLSALGVETIGRHHIIVRERYGKRGDESMTASAQRTQ